MIMRIIRWIISFFTRHKKGVIVGAAAIGGAGAGAGIFNAHKAKKINRQALDIQQNALERHEQAYQETQAVLALLGEVEKDAIDSFVHFADTMERIQGRPKFKSNIFSTVKLPNYEPEEIKNLSAEVRMAIDGAVGAGAAGFAGEPRQLCRHKHRNGAAGALAGLAVFLLYAGLYRRCAAVCHLCTAQCGADHPGGAAGFLAGAAHPWRVPDRQRCGLTRKRRTK